MGNTPAGAHGSSGGRKHKHGRKKKKGQHAGLDPAVLAAFPDRRWDAGEVARLVDAGRLAPLALGTDERTTEQAEECPICFMCFTDGLNRTACCHHALCTKCLLTLQPRPFHAAADPFAHNSLPLPFCVCVCVPFLTTPCGVGSFSVRCPFCKNATLEVTFSGPLSLEAARAQRREDEQVEAQRIHAEHEQHEQQQERPVVIVAPFDDPHGTPAMEEPREEKEEVEEDEDEDMDALLGDGYSATTDTALLVAWLRRLGLGAADAAADAVLAEGAVLAQRLEALCTLHELARAEDVRRACACCADPAAAADIDPAARVCAQLINALA